MTKNPNYWVISPNVNNDKSNETDWKNAFMQLGYIFLGWNKKNPQGRSFEEKMQQGDVVLVAQGANKNKRLLMAGVVSSDAVWEHKGGTPREAFNRKLNYIVSQQELNSIGLDFENTTNGNSNQIRALYQLHPEKNAFDKLIAQRLEQAIKSKEEKMKEINHAIEILKHKNQIILQGAPGTGKTYIAKDIAEQLIFGKAYETKKEQSLKLEKSKQYRLVQFHPSYSYEDFVRGIVVDTAKGEPEYITKNKILANFAQQAIESWDLYNLEKEKAKEVLEAKSKFDQFIDNIQFEIDEKEKFWLTDKVYLFEYDDTRFKYKGDNWEAHSNGLNMKYSELRKIFDSGFTERSEIKKISYLDSLTISHVTYYTKMAEKFAEYKPKKNLYDTVNKELQNYVLIIDEINRANLPAVLGELIYTLEYREESVESMYAVEGNNKLMIPPNLYIIGTMNTADRSVGQIDYAIRRRFAFIDMLPKELEEVGFDRDLFEEVSGIFIQNYAEYKNNPKAILIRSEYLSDEFRPEDVWLGHSYFLMETKEGKSIREMRLNYEIKPILKEYLKDGILKASAKTKIDSLK